MKDSSENVDNVPTSSQDACLPSSPPVPSSRGSAKVRKPPPITPNRFNRFFNPRSRGSCASKSGRSGRELREITANGVNRRNGSAKSPLIFDDFPDPRPTKRRKASLADENLPVYSSPIAASTTVGDSPLRSSPCPVPELDHEEDDQDEEEEEEEEEEGASWPKPIQKSKSRKLLEYVPDWRCGTANFVSYSADLYSFSPNPRSLPFCTVACNTNSLVAVGQENGTVILLDTDHTKKFSTSYLTISAHDNAIMDLAFSDDDYLLGTASGDQRANITDMRTQQVIETTAGHFGSVKQIAFQPGNDKLFATTGRDGAVAIWDRRTSNRSAILACNTEEPLELSVPTQHENAHSTDGNLKSVTSFRFLPGSRSHLFLTGSDANSQIKLWDLRNARGRAIRHSKPLPVSTSAPIPNHKSQRAFGINSISISNDSSRVYTLCKDSIVYVYSMNHLVLGQAPELATQSSKKRLDKPINKEGALPLYGLGHENLSTGTFYVKSAIRPCPDSREELLAVGSSNGCAVVFPTDEHYLRKMPCSVPTSGFPYITPPSSYASNFDDSTPTKVPLYSNNVGTALIRGHGETEVTDVTWTYAGDLVTIGDDKRARCWREDQTMARRLRKWGHKKVKIWGWASVDPEWDVLDDPAELEEREEIESEFAAA